MASHTCGRSRIQEAEPERSRSASPGAQDPHGQGNAAPTCNYRLRDSPPFLHHERPGPSNPAASPTDRFIQRQRATPGQRQERRSAPVEVLSEGAGHQRLAQAIGETRASVEVGRTLANPIEIEEGVSDEEEDDDSSSKDSSEADLDPGSDESERPQPGYGAHLQRDANFYFVDPDRARPTVEEGADPIVALQAQRDDYQRSEQRIRKQLVEAEDRVRAQNEELNNLNERMRYARAESDYLLDQLNQQGSGGARHLDQLRSQIREHEATNRRWEEQQFRLLARFRERNRLYDIERERVGRLDERVRRQIRQIEEQNNQIQDQRQQIADLTARLNTPLQPQHPMRQPRQRQQAFLPPRRRLPRACKARVQSYRAPRG